MPARAHAPRRARPDRTSGPRPFRMSSIDVPKRPRVGYLDSWYALPDHRGDEPRESEIVVPSNVALALAPLALAPLSQRRPTCAPGADAMAVDRDPTWARHVSPWRPATSTSPTPSASTHSDG